MKNSALYIHIPFCDHKCIYCDFYSIITSDNIGAYLDALKKEIEYYSGLYSNGRKYSSIFFGGGTPSLMEPGYLHDIIAHLKEHYKVTPDAEITMETNPGTVTKEKLSLFRQAGINRISIGIQSFDDNELKFLTRIHNKDEAVNTVYNAKEAGFDNISIDLIFNLPGQAKERWLNNLSIAAELPVNHISAYSLILERGTILNKLVLDKKVVLQDDDYDAELYESTIDFLTGKGFEQYEVSNFAKRGYECVHNLAYWRYRDYLSFGTSSHSFVNGRRWWNYSSLKKYISEIDISGSAVAGFEDISEEQKFSEYVMLTLRSNGLDIAELRNLFGNEWLDKNYSYFSMLGANGLLSMEDKQIKLTGAGYAVCDEILAKIL